MEIVARLLAMSLPAEGAWAGLMMREFVQYYLSSIASLGSPGVDELRWNLPVRQTR